MSVQSDAAKAWIEQMLDMPYLNRQGMSWRKEYRFAPPRLWRFDYAVPAILCANYLSTFLRCNNHITPPRRVSIIEIDGGTFQNTRTGHSSGVGLRNWREKNNAAMSAGWKVYHFAPEEIIKAGRKSSQHITAERKRICRTA